MSAGLSWHHERLDEMCARVQQEASDQADRIIAEMSTFEPYSFREQREMLERTGQAAPDRRPWSDWEIHRIIVPRLLRELDEIGVEVVA